MASEEEETEPAEEIIISQEKIDRLEALAERFDILIRGKTLHDVVKPEFQLATEVYLRAAAQRVAEGKHNLLTSLLIAVSWGIYVAENGASKLTEDLTQLH